MDPVLTKLLLPFNMKLHHLTPNAIVQISKFIWAVRTFGGPVSVDAFCRLYELHPQSRKISLAGEEEPCEAQSGCCTFVPRKNNKKLKPGLRGLNYHTPNGTSGRVTGCSIGFT